MVRVARASVPKFQATPHLPRGTRESAPGPIVHGPLALDTAPARALVSDLLAEALAQFEGDRQHARRCLEQAILLADGRQTAAVSSKGALADWQLRRAVDHINRNLGSPLRIEDVARVVKLSPSYFSRAFRITTGESYTDYVMRARIALAQRLLLSTDTSISEIALMCGLSDQAHLTRLFRRVVGLPPSRWRRGVLLAPPRRSDP